MEEKESIEKIKRIESETLAQIESGDEEKALKSLKSMADIIREALK